MEFGQLLVCHFVAVALPLHFDVFDVKELLPVGLIDNDENVGDALVEVDCDGFDGRLPALADVGFAKDQLVEEVDEGGFFLLEPLLEADKPLLVLTHLCYKN